VRAEERRQRVVVRAKAAFEANAVEVSVEVER
jgi:hypothetical protein